MLKLNINMDRGHTIIMFFLSYITDYPILMLRATMVPAYGFQDTASTNNQTKWWTQQDQSKRQANRHLGHRRTQKQIEIYRNQVTIKKQAELPLWQSGAQKETESFGDKVVVRKQAELPLWQAKTQKQANLRPGNVEVRNHSDLRLGPAGAQMQTKLRSKLQRASKQKKKKKRLSISAIKTTSTRTSASNGALKVKTRTLSNITDQRKQFQEDPSQSRGQINPYPGFQNQLRSYLQGGQMAPIEYQKAPTQIRSQINPTHLQNNPSEWGRQKGSMQFQNQLRIANKTFQNERGSVQTGGQRLPIQFQGQPTQRRGQMTRINNTQYKIGISQMGRQQPSKQFQAQSQILNKNFINRWGTGQLGSQMAPMRIQRKPAQMRDQMYPIPIEQHKMGPTQRGRKEGPTRFQNQVNPQNGRQINPMQHNYSSVSVHQAVQKSYERQTIRRPWNPYHKKVARDFNNEATLFSTTRLTGIRSKARTMWSDWIPPYSINDEYYPDSITAPAKGDGVSPIDGHFPTGYHPNEPRFDMTATIPPSTTLPTPSTASGLGSAECDELKNQCMRAYLTAPICARTVFFTYLTYPNYCLMDYVNCVEQLEVWNIVHMGKCYEVKPLNTSYQHYGYFDDCFLDETMLIDKYEEY